MKVFQCYPCVTHGVFFTSFLILLGITGKYSYVVIVFCLRVDEATALCTGVTPKTKLNFDTSVLCLFRWKGQSETSTKEQLLVLLHRNILFTSL